MHWKKTNPDKQGCFSLLQEEVLAGYLNKNLPIEPSELSFYFSPASLQLKEASGAEERGAVLGLAHFKTQNRNTTGELYMFHEGDIGGYPIPQYRKEKWQIPKYRVENRLNTDTVYFNHIYNRLRILMVASI